jgi:hypothetical protein
MCVLVSNVSADAGERESVCVKYVHVEREREREREREKCVHAYRVHFCDLF